MEQLMAVTYLLSGKIGAGVETPQASHISQHGGWKFTSFSTQLFLGAKCLGHFA